MDDTESDMGRSQKGDCKMPEIALHSAGSCLLTAAVVAEFIRYTNLNFMRVRKNDVQIFSGTIIHEHRECESEREKNSIKVYVKHQHVVEVAKKKENISPKSLKQQNFFSEILSLLRPFIRHQHQPSVISTEKTKIQPGR